MVLRVDVVWCASCIYMSCCCVYVRICLCLCVCEYLCMTIVLCFCRVMKDHSAHLAVLALL